MVLNLGDVLRGQFTVQYCTISSRTGAVVLHSTGAKRSVVSEVVQETASISFIRDNKETRRSTQKSKI